MAKFAAYFHPLDRTFQPGIPADRMRRITRGFKRRLSDQLEELFYRAIAEQDGRTASCLYVVLEDMSSRFRQRGGRERRISDQMLARARKALDRCQPRQTLDPPRDQANDDVVLAVGES